VSIRAKWSVNEWSRARLALASGPMPSSGAAKDAESDAEPEYAVEVLYETSYFVER
jgi:hypothetical protein